MEEQSKRPIELKSAPLKVVRILKKTAAEMLRSVKVGDVLQVKTDLRDPGRNRGVYATYVTIENMTKGTYCTKSQTEAAKLLEQTFELEPLEGEQA